VAEERRAAAEAGDAAGYIIKIDSARAEQILFEEMAHNYAKILKAPEIPDDIRQLGKPPDRVALIVHLMMMHYTGTMLGGQIISPQFGLDIFIDRVIQVAEILLHRVGVEKLRELGRKIREKKVKGEDVIRELQEIQAWKTDVFIATREVINRFLTAMHINAPPPVRPPLVNIKLGYDKQET